MKSENDITPTAPAGLPVLHRSWDLNVTIGFSTTNKFMSRVIRWATGGEVSHAWFSFYDDVWGMQVIAQAEWFGYEVRPRYIWEKENILVTEFKPDVEHAIALHAIQTMMKEVGSKYDYRGATIVFIANIVQWFKQWTKSRFRFRPSQTPKKLMCAEATIYFLRELGYRFAKRLGLETTSPVILRSRCAGHITQIFGKPITKLQQECNS